MATRIIIRNYGGPEVLEVGTGEVGAPGSGEIRIRHTVIGLNYIDTYFRSGLYPPPSGLPFTPGLEAAGVVEAVGDGVTSLAEKVIALPDSIDDETAAAMMLKGMTTQYLLRQTYPVKAGETILFHAAAGGVGLIAGQWAKHLGATVIGTAGTPEKAALAKAHGYDHVILYREENIAERVKEITGGKGVPVVYDGVGKDTFEASLDALAPRGLLVSFGNASGPVTGVNLGILAAKGSLYVTRPTLAGYTATRADLEACAGELIDVVSKGAVAIEVNQRFALTDAQKAHETLESRGTTGCTVLLP
jgi:NADPH2:quinone reductase